MPKAAAHNNNHPEARLQYTPEGLRCAGHWVVSGLAAVEVQMATLACPPERRLTFDASSIDALDSAGALLLCRTVERLEAAGCAVSLKGLSASGQSLLELVSRHPHVAVPLPPRPSLLEEVGRNSIGLLHQGYAFLAFFGEVATAAWPLLWRPWRFRWRFMLRELEAAGFRALPIVGLLSFLLGVVIAWQGGVQLRQYGANLYIADLVGISMLRELAPLMTAVIVAGRTGSAFTAQIGTMKVTDEIDALRTLGIHPLEILVLPRMLALVLALPLLTVFADVLGLLGGIVVAKAVLGLSALTFLERVTEAVSLASYLIGIGKAPVFAAIIAAVGCFQGLQVRESAESVGRRTTASVVQSIFLVIVVDAAFSVAFADVAP